MVRASFTNAGDPAALGPGQPAVQQRFGFYGCVGLVDLAEPFLEQGGAVERPVHLLDRGQLDLLAVGEVLGVLPHAEPRTLEVLRERHVLIPARLAPQLPANLIQGVGRELHHVEGVNASLGLRGALGDGRGDPAAISQDTDSTCLQRSSPSASKNASTVWLSRPGAAHTSLRVS